MQDNKFFKYTGGLTILAVVFLVGISVGRNYQFPASETTSPNNPQATASLMIMATAGLRPTTICQGRLFLTC